MLFFDNIKIDSDHENCFVFSPLENKFLLYFGVVFSEE